LSCGSIHRDSTRLPKMVDFWEVKRITDDSFATKRLQFFSVPK
jgi:hypothetical protein